GDVDQQECAECRLQVVLDVAFFEIVGLDCESRLLQLQPVVARDSKSHRRRSLADAVTRLLKLLLTFTFRLPREILRAGLRRLAKQAARKPEFVPPHATPSIQHYFPLIATRSSALAAPSQ